MNNREFLTNELPETSLNKKAEVFLKIKNRRAGIPVHELVQSLNLPKQIRESIDNNIKELEIRHLANLEELNNEFSSDQNLLNRMLSREKQNFQEMLKVVLSQNLCWHFAAFKDERMEIANFQYLKASLVDIVDDLLQTAESESDFDKVGVFFFDADNLKKFNDLEGATHETGDRYLTEITKILTLGKTVSWLETMKIKVVPAHRTGDEFMMALSGKALNQPPNFPGIDQEPIESSLLDYVIKKIQQEVEAIDLENIAGKDLAKTITFKPGISGGGANLKEIIKNLSPDEEADLEHGNYEYEEALLKFVVSKIFNSADEAMKKNKKQRKAGR